VPPELDGRGDDLRNFRHEIHLVDLFPKQFRRIIHTEKAENKHSPIPFSLFSARVFDGEFIVNKGVTHHRQFSSFCFFDTF
jgi:hypothetical protein